MKEYRKTATVKAKIFEPGDEDGMIAPQGYTMHDAMENDKYGIEHPELVPYISTLENQHHRGEFYKNYVCTGIKGERWLVEKSIFESTYEPVREDPSQIVAELNQRYIEKYKEENPLPFEYITDGFNSCINFFDTRIWFDDEDEREFDEETNQYEPLERFLIRKATELVSFSRKFNADEFL